MQTLGFLVAIFAAFCAGIFIMMIYYSWEMEELDEDYKLIVKDLEREVDFYKNITEQALKQRVTQSQNKPIPDTHSSCQCQVPKVKEKTQDGPY